jgi:tetratricopeptide (TPR) repeat protein
VLRRGPGRPRRRSAGLALERRLGGSLDSPGGGHIPRQRGRAPVDRLPSPAAQPRADARRRQRAYNATEALVALGRWEQAEQVSREGLEVVPSDAASVTLPLARAALELARGDLDRAEARLRTVRRLLPAPIPEAQKAGPLFAGLAELAVWRGDLEQAKQLVAEAVPLVEANPRYAAPLYALGMRVEADRAELARARHPGEPACDDGTATALLERLGQAAQGPAAAGLPELAAWHAIGRAERTRQDGPSDPAAWAVAVAAWERLGQPYRVAYARFRQAEAMLAAGDRDTAAVALRRAAAITGRLGAHPLEGEVKALARRARLDLAPHAAATVPAAAAPTPAAQLGLTGARPRCSRWWRPGAATARSPGRCSSAPRPPASTSPGCLLLVLAQPIVPIATNDWLEIF